MGKINKDGSKRKAKVSTIIQVDGKLFQAVPAKLALAAGFALGRGSQTLSAADCSKAGMQPPRALDGSRPALELLASVMTPGA